LYTESHNFLNCCELSLNCYNLILQLILILLSTVFYSVYFTSLHLSTIIMVNKSFQSGSFRQKATTFVYTLSIDKQSYSADKKPRIQLTRSPVHCSDVFDFRIFHRNSLTAIDYSSLTDTDKTTRRMSSVSSIPRRKYHFMTYFYAPISTIVSGVL